ncbi:MAG TPA: 3-keto-5-aminohexanoate cleavage protein [Woeseiaceae bacterium]|nr:3-keto-5-aminohexanoate cleavage protein [Woeseiaceae bacterium]
MTTACQLFARDRVMIVAAPNGARRARADHAALPLSAAELADCAVQLREAGASVLHLHVRDGNGHHTLDAAAYREATRRIRQRIGDDLVLQVTTEAVGRYTAAQQMALVRELHPEAVSLALRELCPSDDNNAFAFFAWLVAERIWPQYILYDAADLRRFDKLRRRGVFAEQHPSCLLVLGRYASGRPGQPGDLDTLLSAVDCSRFPWTACCFGAHEQAVMLAALQQGGHVRIGFENNLLLADGSVAADNAALIRQFTAAACHAERRPATAAEVRRAFLPAHQG